MAAQPGSAEPDAERAQDAELGAASRGLGGDPPPPSADAGSGPALLRRLLRIPLFYKILIANAAIVVVGTVLGTAATIRFIQAEPGHSPAEVVVPLALLGACVTLLVNALILHLALGPIRQLEQAAARIQGGDLDARAPQSQVADRELERLIRTFNAALDNLAAYRQRMRDVAAHALNAEEEERKRIARELHDETAQTLAALLIRLRLARGVTDPAAHEALLEEIRREITGALEGVRRFARGLRPPALDELGLVPAIESHARAVEESVGLSIRIESAPLDNLLWPQAELALYRIVQEALSNAVRHAGARRVLIRITRDDAVVSATVEDDGRGFDPKQIMSGEGSGLGLFGMQERAAYLGGRVEIASRPGHGTRVRAAIPISDSATYA